MLNIDLRKNMFHIKGPEPLIKMELGALLDEYYNSLWKNHGEDFAKRDISNLLDSILKTKDEKERDLMMMEKENPEFIKFADKLMRILLEDESDEK